MSTRLCDWCRGGIPATARRDSICCSKRCRQARHRFRTAIAGAPVATGQPRRLAYADPPYPGKAHYYRNHPDYGGEVDHAVLIASLSAEYDAWALSTSASRLQDVLALCPPGVRVAAWFRGERPNNRTDLPQNAWEPVIYAGDIRRAAPAERDGSGVAEYPHDGSSVAPHRGAPRLVAPVLGDASRPPGERVAHAGQYDASGRAAARRVAEISDDISRSAAARRVDTLVYAARPRLTDPGRVIGAKPAVFCRWIFDLLGATPADELVDVFPGSAGVSRAWSVFSEEASSA